MKKQFYLPLFVILSYSFLTAQTITFGDKEILFDHPDGDTFSSIEFENAFIPCDYNNDGYVDFVGKRSFDEQLILKGTAVDTTFEEINVLPSGSPTVRKVFDVLDFDQDGDEDIIAETYLLLNDGEDDFSFVSLDLETASGINEFVIGVADFNDDNLLDLLVLKDVFFEDAEVSILTNNGDGTFAKCLIFDQGDDIGDTEIGDIDQDGDLDIVMSSGDDNGTILLFKNEGACQFVNSTLIYQDFTPLSERSLAVHDMNGDGKLDIIITAFSSIFIFENSDGFVSEPNFTTIEVGMNSFFRVVDFNNDSQPDIVVLTRSGAFQAEVFRNLGNLSFGLAQIAAAFTLAPAHGSPDYNYLEQNMSIYDYDDNGTKDIIYTNGFGPLGSNNVILVPNTTEVVSVDDIFSSAAELSVFPNPAAAEINLPLSTVSYDNAAFFQLINNKGQTVKRGNLTQPKVDISDLAKGQYFLLINTGDELYRSQFIKL